MRRRLHASLCRGERFARCCFTGRGCMRRGLDAARTRRPRSGCIFHHGGVARHRHLLGSAARLVRLRSLLYCACEFGAHHLRRRYADWLQRTLAAWHLGPMPVVLLCSDDPGAALPTLRPFGACTLVRFSVFCAVFIIRSNVRVTCAGRAGRRRRVCGVGGRLRRRRRRCCAGRLVCSVPLRCAGSIELDILVLRSHASGAGSARRGQWLRGSKA